MRGADRALEPALLTSGAMDGEAQSASSERSPGWAQRTSGDGAWAAPGTAIAAYEHLPLPKKPPILILKASVTAGIRQECDDPCLTGWTA